jgi:5'-nucleotidase
LLQPGILLEKAGLRIGLVGLTTQQTAITSSPGPNVRFTDPASALAAQAAVLRNGGARLVVALSHLGVDIDQRLAGNVGGVDVFVGGHTHTLLSDSEAGATGPAHAVHEGAAGRAVVVQAACYGRYFGRLDLDVAEDGAVLAYGGDTRHVGLEWPEHPKIAAIVASYAVQLDSVRSRVIGHAPQAVEIATCRIAECAFGSFVAEAMLAATHGAEVALMNGGGLRTGLPSGNVTMGDVLSALPFGNTLATVQLTGADLRTALENGLARAGAGGFPQMAGMRVRWNPLADPASRLRLVQVRQADGGLHDMERDRLYTVVTNNFMRTGGDGYTVMRDQGLNAYDTGPGLDQVVADAIIRAVEIAPVTDGRIGFQQ